MSRLYKITSTGLAAVPTQGRIGSITLDNTSGGAVNVTIADGDGGIDFEIDLGSNEEKEFRFHGIDYNGGLTIGGDVSASDVLFIEIL